jgi:uncharacterized protein YcbK (DUF882 family)
MPTRRTFLQHSFALGAGGLVGACASSPTVVALQGKTVQQQPPTSAAPSPKPQPSAGPMSPPPDIFDATTLDIDFWVKPRTISVVRSATGEKAELRYWKDGEINESAYQQLCHLLRDVQGGVTKQVDPRLLELLWATQAFIARYGMTAPLEILSGYRTPETNRHLIEQGVPAARKSLHMEGKAADIRIASLDSEVLGSLIHSFRQGGVGFYYRQTKQGGWIHADTGLQRTWNG